MSSDGQTTYGRYATASILNSVGMATGAWNKLRLDWALIDDLCGGTITMREASTKWLPKHQAEDENLYKLRLGKSFLYEGLADTISRVCTKPFSKQVVVSGKLPDRLKPMEKSCDVTGSTITEFSSRILESAAKYGMVGVLVEFPATDSTKNLKTEKAEQPTPYFILVEPKDILGWRTSRDNLGRIKFTEVRIREIRVESKIDDYGEQTVEYIRVYRENDYSLYRVSGDKSEHVETSDHTFGRVPFEMFYVAKTGFMMADPPFRALAWINCHHWQSSSEQNNILGVARCGILFGRGFGPDELKSIVVGPNHVVKTTNPEASLEWVEHTGQAIPAGERHTEQLEAKMQILGLQPFIQRHSGATATGVAVDETRANTEIEAWCRALEVFLLTLFKMAAEWLKLSLPEDLKLDINTDFGISVRTIEDCRMVLDLYRSNPTTVMLKMVMSEFRRRGVISDYTDVEAVAEESAAENPLVMIGQSGMGTSQSGRIGGISNMGGKGGSNGMRGGSN